MKIWRNSNPRHERIPSSLAECLDRPPSTRREAWRFWLIILLILPTLYYLNDLLIYEKIKFLNRGSKIDAAVTVQTTEKVVPTTRTSEMATTGNFSVKTLWKKEFLENQYPSISVGGYYSPVSCQSRHKVAILVPYRDREENLAMFIYNIHPFLMKQKLEYRIFIIEQKGTDKFNKGRLFNAGFEEIKKYGSWHCVVFHDVDLIPVDEKILYSCPFWPRHMCGTVIQKINDSSYHALFGGVTSMIPAHYEMVNGYSNLYWGWGGEDNDMFWRLRFAGLPVTRYNRTIARYISLPHILSTPNPLRYHFLRGGLGRFKQDGLSSLEYKLVSVTERHLYTHIVVDINPARINANPIKLLRKLRD